MTDLSFHEMKAVFQYPPSLYQKLFFAMFFGVSDHSIFGVLSGVNYVASRSMSMVGRLFVLSGIVMFGGFPVVTSGVR